MVKQTNVLIVDDSRIFRSALEACLAGEDDINVCGSVRNGIKALEFIESHRPDLVVLDVEMPDMDGFATLKAIEDINRSRPEENPIGVLMLSASVSKGSETSTRALDLGACDVIAKPENPDVAKSIEMIRRQLVVKVRYFASQRIGSAPSQETAPPVKQRESGRAAASNIQAVLIGTSTGGPKALTQMLPSLCDTIEQPIFVVQHMPPTFTDSLATSLDARCSHTVVEGRHEEIVKPRTVYIAPGGKHMLVARRGADVMIVLSDQPPENGCRPCVDVLFRSAMPVYGGNAIAIVLTGMGSDGTKGLASLKRAGAHVVVQDKETSVVWGMPGSAVASGNVDDVLPLNKIPDAVAAVIRGKRTGENG